MFSTPASYCPGAMPLETSPAAGSVVTSVATPGGTARVSAAAIASSRATASA